jgi:hypothetical protein
LSGDKVEIVARRAHVSLHEPIAFAYVRVSIQLGDVGGRTTKEHLLAPQVHELVSWPYHTWIAHALSSLGQLLSTLDRFVGCLRDACLVDEAAHGQLVMADLDDFPLGHDNADLVSQSLTVLDQSTNFRVANGK